MPKLQIFENLAKLPPKMELLEKFELTDKTGFELTETRRAESFLHPSQLPLTN